ncbi:Protein phosphatase 2C [Artemisia annua]|uniref:protein-serine/threonine phosphatase n=1 Tax=Artemisia annua TaxID=35608 RepID=A0A2U1PJM7_ARTAN|nr:Protein phosphatase 2C [Artemisia annua]
MLEGLMNLLSVCWKPFIKGDGSETSGATVGVNGNYNNNGGGDGDDFEKDGLLWYKDIGKYYGGEYSMAVVQANQVLEDQSQIESGSFGTFVGVYDGHGGPDVARYVCDNLFRNFQAITAEDYGVVTPDTIKNAYLQTENGFTSLVAELFNERPGIATVGSCCLVGVIYQQTLFVANLGDARVVLGKKVGNTGGMAAIQLSSEHNANLEEVRHELKSLHPHDPNIVALKHGVWRVKGIIQVSRSIGDVYMKHSEYNNDQIAQKFRLPESTVMPIMSATPSILTHDIHPSDSFLIFASDGLWEHLSNEEAVEIVHNNPRAGIAKRLVKAALHEAAKKREMRYSDLRKIDKRVRRHFHDDITVIVLFLNYDQISRGAANGPHVSLRSALEH